MGLLGDDKACCTTDAAQSEMKAQACSAADGRSSEQAMVDLIRMDLGVTIDPQAWRMFVRYRWHRMAPLAHRINDGFR